MKTYDLGENIIDRLYAILRLCAFRDAGTHSGIGVNLYEGLRRSISDSLYDVLTEKENINDRQAY